MKGLISIITFGLFVSNNISRCSDSNQSRDFFPLMEEITTGECFGCKSKKIEDKFCTLFLSLTAHKVNSKKYYSFSSNASNNEIDGYVRYENDKLYFLHRDYDNPKYLDSSSYPVLGIHGDITKEQVLFYFNKKIGYSWEVYNIGGFLDSYILKVAKVNVDNSGDSVFVYDCLVTKKAIRFEGHLYEINYDSIYVSKQYGIVRTRITDSDGDSIICNYKQN